MTKTCPNCKETKPIEGFARHNSRADRLQVHCKACNKAYRIANKEAIKAANLERYGATQEHQRAKAREWYRNNTERGKARSAAWYAANRGSALDYMRTRGQELKAAALNAYGGPVCVCCGEDNPLFMSIDHIVPCGTIGRKKHGGGSAFYRWLLKNEYPEGFQVLCFNCNLGRNVTRGECPHKLAAAT